MKFLSNVKVTEFLLVVSALALPLFLNVSIISWILIALIRLSFPEERKAMFLRFKENKLLWMLPLLYLIYVLGLGWTSNFKYAGLDLQIKLTFFLLPITIGTLHFSYHQTKKVLYGFVVGTFIASVYLLIKAYSVYLETNDSLSFFYASFTSPLMHPTYFGMYVNFALIILLAQVGKGAIDWKLFCIGGALTFFFIVAILIEARTAQAATLITVLGMMLYNLVKRNYSTSSLLLLCFLIFFCVGANRYLNSISNRYQLVVSAMESKTQTDNKKQYDSTTGRIEIWKLAGGVIRENIFLGTGTGDVRDELVKTYYANDFEYGYAKKLNAHNQFLQIWATVGIIGLLLFVMALLLPLLKLGVYPQLVFPAFLVLILLNALTESTMEVQRGVLFFALFYSLLASRPGFEKPMAVE